MAPAARGVRWSITLDTRLKLTTHTHRLCYFITLTSKIFCYPIINKIKRIKEISANQHTRTHEWCRVRDEIVHSNIKLPGKQNLTVIIMKPPTQTY